MTEHRENLVAAPVWRSEPSSRDRVLRPRSSTLRDVVDDAVNDRGRALRCKHPRVANLLLRAQTCPLVN